MSAIIFILCLAFLIIVHEFGHFLAAKKSGMKVEEFGVGLPPRIWGTKKERQFIRLMLCLLEVL